MIRLYGNVIFWKTQKQNIVTKSSTHAEYVALSSAVSELIFIKGILQTFNLVPDQIQIYEDNISAIEIVKHGNFTKNSEHIEVHYHFVHENYQNGVININYVNSEDNIAHIFTKALGKNKFVEFRKKLKLI
ncbi:MAG: Ty1/Copia family ribonuclease HI [Spiroplasma ixodetis]|nr:Ty1/Copia family ribonuclease HI [Spiroplasma ixodetis]